MGPSLKGSDPQSRPARVFGAGNVSSGRCPRPRAARAVPRPARVPGAARALAPPAPSRCPRCPSRCPGPRRPLRASTAPAHSYRPDRCRAGLSYAACSVLGHQRRTTWRQTLQLSQKVPHMSISPTSIKVAALGSLVAVGAASARRSWSLRVAASFAERGLPAVMLAADVHGVSARVGVEVAGGESTESFGPRGCALEVRT